jgi:hypothetical protein
VQQLLFLPTPPTHTTTTTTPPHPATYHVLLESLLGGDTRVDIGVDTAVKLGVISVFWHPLENFKYVFI